MDTCYTMLGVSETASGAEIKVAYRKLIQEFHPDTVPTASAAWRKVATEKTQELNEAYTILSKDRATYDAQIAAQRPKPAAPKPPAPQRNQNHGNCQSQSQQSGAVKPQPSASRDRLAARVLWGVWGFCWLCILTISYSGHPSPMRDGLIAGSIPKSAVTTAQASYAPAPVPPLPAWTPALGAAHIPNAGTRFINKPWMFHGVDYCTTDGYGIPSGELDIPDNRVDDPACRVQPVVKPKAPPLPARKDSVARLCADTTINEWCKDSSHYCGGEDRLEHWKLFYDQCKEKIP
jgi:hypothetical protein